MMKLRAALGTAHLAIRLTASGVSRGRRSRGRLCHAKSHHPANTDGKLCRVQHGAEAVKSLLEKTWWWSTGMGILGGFSSTRSKLADDTMDG
jgi:hypothetical protein